MRRVGALFTLALSALVLVGASGSASMRVPSASSTLANYLGDDRAESSSHVSRPRIEASAPTEAEAPLADLGDHIVRYTYDYRSDFARLPPAEAAHGEYDTTNNPADPAEDLGRVRRAFSGSVVQRVAPRAAGLADEAVATGRTASTSWGRTVQDFQQYGDQWRRVSAHAEAATGRAYRGATSIEEVFERSTDRLVRHRIYGPNGEILHETFRPYAKFGTP